MENTEKNVTFLDFINWLFYRMLFKLNKLELTAVLVMYVMFFISVISLNITASFASFNFTIMLLVNLNSNLIIKNKDIVLDNLMKHTKSILNLNDQLIEYVKELESKQPKPSKN